MNKISILKNVWLKPRNTIKSLTNENFSELTIVALIYLGGISYGLNRAEMKSIGDSKSIGEILIFVIIFSGFGGLITYHIMIWLINFSSTKFFKGQGNFKNMRKAFALSMIPSVVIVLISFLSMLLFGIENFQEETPRIDSSTFLTISYYFIAFFGLILGIWKAYILVISTSQVQSISNRKAIFSIISGFLIIIIPIVILMLLFF